LRGGETIRLNALDTEFRVLPVPGHTLGHLAYYGAGCVFCGDTLFGAGCGRLFEGSPAQMLDSLERLAALPDDTAVYCAHEYTEANLRFALAVEAGNRTLRARVDEVAVTRAKGLPTVPSTIALEKATNPFLRCSEPAVIASAKNREAGISGSLQVFTALREWKNVY
jgi:hydroxyacylglutathione hydrolase